LLEVSKSEPDGYTLLVVDLSALTMAPTLMKNLTYDPAKELTPVAIVAYSPHILVVANKLPVKTLPELIAYARSQSVPLNFGTPLGAAPHLAGVLLAQKENLQLNFIGYKGGSQVIADLAGGQIDLTMNSFLATYPMAKAGNYRMIAVASPERFAPIPETPTIAERIPGYVTGSFQGMMAPSATPQAIIAKLNAEIAKIAVLPDIRKQFADLGSEALPRSPADLRKWLADETTYWAKVIQTGNVKID
jgi:tripartite-type tricarboxylate transporter receptor subunit TctC